MTGCPEKRTSIEAAWCFLSILRPRNAKADLGSDGLHLDDLSMKSQGRRSAEGLSALELESL